MSPKVTVVIPYFNMGRFIDETLDSVKKQTYKEEIEVILVDDGSSERESVGVLDKLENAGWPEVIHQKNAGLPAARNAGTKRAKGIYIACLDADDIYHPDFIQKCVEVLEADKDRRLGFVTTYVQMFGVRDGLWKIEDYNAESRIRMLAQDVVHGNSMFRKEAWERAGGYDEQMTRGYEDWDFWISLLEAGYIWHRIPQPLFNYRCRAGSMWAHSAQIHDELYAALVDNHPAFYKANCLDLIKLMAKMINEQDQLIKAQEQFIGGRTFIVFAAARKLIARPERFLELGNYSKFIRKLFKG